MQLNHVHVIPCLLFTRAYTIKPRHTAQGGGYGCDSLPAFQGFGSGKFGLLCPLLTWMTDKVLLQDFGHGGLIETFPKKWLERPHSGNLWNRV